MSRLLFVTLTCISVKCYTDTVAILCKSDSVMNVCGLSVRLSSSLLARRFMQVSGACIDLHSWGVKKEMKELGHFKV